MTCRIGAPPPRLCASTARQIGASFTNWGLAPTMLTMRIVMGPGDYALAAHFARCVEKPLNVGAEATLPVWAISQPVTHVAPSLRTVSRLTLLKSTGA